MPCISGSATYQADRFYNKFMGHHQRLYGARFSSKRFQTTEKNIRNETIANASLLNAPHSHKLDAIRFVSSRVVLHNPTKCARKPQTPASLLLIIKKSFLLSDFRCRKKSGTSEAL